MPELWEGAVSYPREGSTIMVKQPIEAYYHRYNGVMLLPGVAARVVNPRVIAVSGNRPYFSLVKFEHEGQVYQASVWPGEWNYA